MIGKVYPLGGKRVYVAGHKGMVGSALVRRLQADDCQVLTAGREVDLREHAAVRDWFAAHRPDAVVVAAAKVGGILASDSYPAEFFYDNLMIEANLIEAARRPPQCWPVGRTRLAGAVVLTRALSR